MSETKFTPGPWLVRGALGHASYIVSGLGDAVACGYEYATDAGAANARLIAAAPEMYAELQCARHTLVIIDKTPEDSPCIKRIDAVLAKARGEV